MHTSTASMMKERRAGEGDRSPLIRRRLLAALWDTNHAPAIGRRRSERLRLAHHGEGVLVEVPSGFARLRRRSRARCGTRSITRPGVEPHTHLDRSGKSIGSKTVERCLPLPSIEIAEADVCN